MNPERFRVLIEGALAVWQVDAEIRFHGQSLRCEIRRADAAPVSIEHDRAVLGGIWRVEQPGRTPRVHRSVVPALATLREALCPHRPRGRALFVTDPQDAS